MVVLASQSEEMAWTDSAGKMACSFRGRRCRTASFWWQSTAVHSKLPVIRLPSAFHVCGYECMYLLVYTMRYIFQPHGWWNWHHRCRPVTGGGSHNLALSQWCGHAIGPKSKPGESSFWAAHLKCTAVGAAHWQPVGAAPDPEEASSFLLHTFCPVHSQSWLMLSKEGSCRSSSSSNMFHLQVISLKSVKDYMEEWFSIVFHYHLHVGGMCVQRHVYLSQTLHFILHHTQA